MNLHWTVNWPHDRKKV